jgi:hypothetical protein
MLYSQVAIKETSEGKMITLRLRDLEGPLRRHLSRRSYFRGSPSYEDPLTNAVAENDFDKVRSYFRQNKLKDTVLYYLVEKKKYDMLNNLIELEELDVNYCDRDDGRSLLMVLTGHSSKLSLKLIEKGADIHITDKVGSTFLHHAVRNESPDNLTVASLIIEKGADVNCRDDNGKTPLYIACEEGHVDWVYTLLYYGADPNIPCHKGIIPLAAISSRTSENKQIVLQDILFPYTFDSDNVTLSLSSMVEVMISETSTFPRLLEKVSRLSYDTADLEYFVERIEYQNVERLKLFVEKFGDVVDDLMDHYQILVILFELTTRYPGIAYVHHFKGILDAFLESDHGSKLIQTSDPSFPTTSHLIKLFKLNTDDMLVEEEQIKKTVFLMLSYGLGVTLEDLDTVYRFYGYCDLFRLLLRMDVQFCDRHKPSSMVRMYCDPSTDLEMCLDDSSSIASLLDHFNHPKLKQLCLSSSNNQIASIAKELPQVPLLAEVARNAARKYIARGFKIETPKQFYSLLDRLAIDRLSKSMIALEIKLY